MPYDSLLLANVYSNYVNILLKIWKYDEAIVYLDKAIELINNKDHEALTIQLIKKGRTYNMMNDLNKALSYSDQAEKYLDPNFTYYVQRSLLELKIAVNSNLENYAEALIYAENFFISKSYAGTKDKSWIE